MIKEFNDLKEIEKYYDKESNTYEFKEDGEHIDLVVFNFNLNIKANIVADDIKARDITAYNIIAWNIVAYDINAGNINYYAVCFAYKNIKCKSIKGKRIKSKHFVLDGKLEVKE